MPRTRTIITALVACALTLVFTSVVFGWPWDTDMYWQKHVLTFEEPPLDPPDGAMAVGEEPPLSREDAGKLLTNPVAPAPESLARGKVFFDNICFPCHGKNGEGDGPVGKKFVTPANLKLPMYVKMTDGYIYGTIRNGGINMPPQGVALQPMERWDVVNYVRSLQKQ